MTDLLARTAQFGTAALITDSAMVTVNARARHIGISIRVPVVLDLPDQTVTSFTMPVLEAAQVGDCVLKMSTVDVPANAIRDSREKDVK